MFAYCENNPIGNSDPDGYFAAALAGGGHLSGILVAGGANFWNPVGWIAVGITVAVGAGFYYYSEHSKRNGSDKRTKDKHQKGNARRQRDQGGEKKKQKSGWKSRR